MRPWFTLTIIAIIAGCLLSFWLVVDFVLLNRVMFEAPFNITVRLPFPPWSHRWTEVQFMYILTVSVLLGAGIVALTTLIFDTKRALKVRHMRKELARLQKALEEAQAKLPSPPLSDDVDKDDVSAKAPFLATESESTDAETSITPEEIAHSFENVVEQGDFLKAAQKRVEDELELHEGRRPEGDVRTIVTGVSGDPVVASGPEEDASESDTDPDNRMPEEADGNQEGVNISEASQETDSAGEEIVESSYAVADDAGQEEQVPSESLPKDSTGEGVDGTSEAGEDDFRPEEVIEKPECEDNNQDVQERNDASDELESVSSDIAHNIETDENADAGSEKIDLDTNRSERTESVSPQGTEPVKKTSSEHSG